jgi:hypothetical protein
MNLSPGLKSLYDGYYNNDTRDQLKVKRDLTALQSVKNLKKLLPKNHYKNILDIGAGDGNTLDVLSSENLSQFFGAIEISESGILEMKNKSIRNLFKIELFDGYKINEINDEYELGVVFHVLEHVEHERLFISEVLRVCQTVYFEVPLEDTFFVNKAVEVGQLYGHINFYNPYTIRALMRDSNLQILNFGIFSHSLEYEQLISGKFVGMFKYYVKSIALKMFPNHAFLLFTYTGGILVSSKSN